MQRKEINLNFTFDVKLNIQEQFVQFLDETNCLKRLKKAVAKYLLSVKQTQQDKLFHPGFRCLIPVDLLMLHDRFESLYEILVLETFYAIELLKEIVLGAIHQNEFLILTKMSDITVQLAINCVPPFLPVNSSLKTIKAVLVAKSFPTKYRRSSVWRCHDRKCCGFKGFRGSTVATCLECGGSVTEDVASQDLGEMQQCKFLPVEAFKENFGSFFPITTEIKDELLREHDLKLGVEYRLTGIFRDSYFEIWAAENCFHSSEALIRSPSKHSVALPPSIADLFVLTRQQHPDSYWVFPAALASNLGSSLLPKSSLLHLKYGLLLSLATLKQNHAPVPVLAVGADTFASEKLMSAVGKLAERHVHSFGSSLGGILTQDCNNVILAEQGSLTAATNGVCNLGDWSKYKQLAGIRTAVSYVERGQIILENRTGLDLPTVILPLKTAVWAYWGHITRAKRDQQQLLTLINVFGMPFLVSEDDDEHERISTKILSNVSDERDFNMDGINVNFEDMQEYLRIAISRQVELTEAASELMKVYFVISRKKRPECLPVGAIKTINSLAEAHARLALRNEVLVEDVIAIIYLYEEAMTNLFGKSDISDYSKIPWDQEEPVHSFINRQMINFSDWLKQYLE